MALVDVLFEASAAARAALDHLDHWGPNPDRPGQYHLDIAADAAALATLGRAGLSVLSEESGRTEGRSPLLAVLDPIDGSTNAHRGLPWYSTSICVFDDQGPWVGVVVNHASGQRFHAIRDAGAWRDERTIRASGCEVLGDSIVGVSGEVAAGFRPWQSRTLGCASLEFCAVADGSLDAVVLGNGMSLHPWDYLAGLLICAEAGASVSELDRLDPWITFDGLRRPTAAASSALLDMILLVTS